MYCIKCDVVDDDDSQTLWLCYCGDCDDAEFLMMIGFPYKFSCQILYLYTYKLYVLRICRYIYKCYFAFILCLFLNPKFSVYIFNFIDL